MRRLDTGKIRLYSKCAVFCSLLLPMWLSLMLVLAVARFFPVLAFLVMFCVGIIFLGGMISGAIFMWGLIDETCPKCFGPLLKPKRGCFPSEIKKRLGSPIFSQALDVLKNNRCVCLQCGEIHRLSNY
jgi:hypothetical protein